ncbi:hypothetical protein [Bacillus thuringiensis]|uniref:hypothetical protein n=1 Tax=Bacillus thuringiensis TaxID=1428 RepID=UPI003DA0F0A8
MSDRIYSTGPILNPKTNDGKHPMQLFYTLVLNQSPEWARITISLFQLGQSKNLVQTITDMCAPNQSLSGTFTVSNLDALEIEYAIITSDDQERFLVSGWGAKDTGILIPEYRFVHKEMHQ